MTNAMPEEILVVNNNLRVGGVQHALVNLLRVLAARHRLSLVLFEEPRPPDLAIPQGVSLVRAGGLSRMLGVSQTDLHSAAWRVTRALLVFWCRYVSSASAKRWALLGAKRLTTEGLAISFLHPTADGQLYGGAAEYVAYRVRARTKVCFIHGDLRRAGAISPSNRQLLNRFDWVACVSPEVKASLVEQWPELAGKAVVVHNFIDEARIQAALNGKHRRLERDCLDVIMVGRVQREKRFDRAVAALALLKSRALNVRLHVVGDGNQLPFVRDLADELNVSDIVTFHGMVEDPLPLIREADLLLLTSEHEAAPLVIDEAIALGTPVLTTQTLSSNSQVLSRDAGWVTGHAPEEIAVAVADVVAAAKGWVRTPVGDVNEQAARDLASLLKRVS